MIVSYNGGMRWDLMGHDWAVQLLQKHISMQHVRHAYLLTGPDGIGKRTLATRFAQALNCEKADGAPTRCGACRTCRQIEAQAYPDLRILQPEDVSATLKVDEVRELSRWLSLAPYQGKWRMALLLDFHQASISAANALLKTLEEPASQVILILTAHSTDDLLPTIVSRCEQIALRPVAIKEIEAGLLELDDDAEKAQEVARLSGGYPGRARSYLEDKEVLVLRAKRLEEHQQLLVSTRAERFAYADAMARIKDPQERRSQTLQVLQYWQLIWRDVLLLVNGADVPLQNLDQEEWIEQISLQVNSKDVMNVIQRIQQTDDAIRRNANVRLALEALLLDFPYIRKV